MSGLRPTVDLAPEPGRHPDFAMATVNIVLLLVLFFLLFGTAASTRLGTIQPPESLALPEADLPRPLLAIDAQGQWSLDRQPMTPEAALARITEAATPGAVLYLLVPGDMAAEELLAALRLLAPGQRAITLITRNRRATP